jgi:hypothetical protein
MKVEKKVYGEKIVGYRKDHSGGHPVCKFRYAKLSEPKVGINLSKNHQRTKTGQSGGKKAGAYTTSKGHYPLSAIFFGVFRCSFIHQIGAEHPNL